MNNALEVVLSCLNIESDGLLLNIWVADDHHNIGGGGEFIDEGCKLLVSHDHRLELEVGLDATELELLDDVTNLLKAMDILVLFGIMVRYN